MNAGVAVPAIERLHVGCGPKAAPGWLNCDMLGAPGVDLRCDLRAGLPLAADRFDLAVAIHVLQDLPYPAVLPALAELRRVLKPGGTLRLAVPHLDRAIRAYIDQQADHFYVPDEDAHSVAAKLVTQIVWYGSARTLCNFGFVHEWLMHAGYRTARRCAFRETYTGCGDAASLDNRELESLFVEAVK